MQTLRLTLEYDGTEYAGWQRQPDQTTVEGAVRNALTTVTGETPTVMTAAGRTDAGAHAHGQVVGCVLQRPWDTERLLHALNHTLPEDIVVTAVQLAPSHFHARHDAIARTYRYAVVDRRMRSPLARRYAWQVRTPLDREAMRSAASLFEGTHDFAAFGRSPRPGGSTVRTVQKISIRDLAINDEQDPGLRAVIIEVMANAFLYGMMRSLAGALVAVGQGRMTIADICRLLTVPNWRGAHITVAPAHGLHQWKVLY